LFIVENWLLPDVSFFIGPKERQFNGRECGPGRHGIRLISKAVLQIPRDESGDDSWPYWEFER
jgi:hypothetical protein